MARRGTAGLAGALPGGTPSPRLAAYLSIRTQAVRSRRSGRSGSCIDASDTGGRPTIESSSGRLHSHAGRSIRDQHAECASLLRTRAHRIDPSSPRPGSARRGIRGIVWPGSLDGRWRNDLSGNGIRFAFPDSGCAGSARKTQSQGHIPATAWRSIQSGSAERVRR